MIRSIGTLMVVVEIEIEVAGGKEEVGACVRVCGSVWEYV